MNTQASNTAIEDYVKAIYTHTEWQPEKISTTALAARLSLAPSSVTEMVKKLVGLGLVSHQPYGSVELTAEGAALALRVIRRHRLIETWLVHEFGYAWDEVHDEAERLEHVISDRLLDAIDARLGHPVRDPHGDAIPASDGTVTRPSAVLLAEAEAGASGRIVRISDRDPALLRDLQGAGATLDANLTIAQRTDARALVDLPGGRREFSIHELNLIWIAVD
ncbi:MAG: metal-dependent transcriptional regulator [Salinibacterium sp.]|nr:MAG: metal-dependent transcriptional regulator [Salinibacterium sp.]